MDEKDLKNINRIDTECVVCDDEDLEDFGGPIKTISANVNEQGVSINKNFDNNIEQDYSQINLNSIDMECSVPDDEDSFIDIKKININIKETPKQEKPALDTSIYYGETVNDWGDDEEFDSKKISNKKINSDDYIMSDDVPYDDTEEIEELNNKELVDEDLIEEKKGTTPGAVEDDYWSKLQKKYKKSNVKSSYNTSMHFAGNPEQEATDFNHGFNTNASNPAEDVSSGEGCCENLNENLDWTSLANDLLAIVGFCLVKNNDNTFVLQDECKVCDDIPCKDNNEVFTCLKPYIDDCFLYPLQITTGEKFTDYKDWCDWYKGENCEKFPNCAYDIKYCDLIANHINDCKF